MPFDPLTQLSAALLIKRPGSREKDSHVAAPELLVDRDTAPGVYLPPTQALSFNTGWKTPEQADRDLARLQTRIEAIVDLGDNARGSGETSFQVKFGFSDGVDKVENLAAHLYLIPAYEASSPPQCGEPMWLGGMTLPVGTPDMTATISAHFVSDKRARPFAFSELSPNDDERTLLLTVHRIFYPPAKATSDSLQPTLKRKRNLKTESFVPDPGHVLAEDSHGLQKVHVGEGLVLKSVRRTEPIKAYVCQYIDSRESPLVEFVFHCRTSSELDTPDVTKADWIRSHSAIDPPSSPSYILRTPLSTPWPNRASLMLYSSPSIPHTPQVISASAYSARFKRKKQKQTQLESDE